MTENPIIEGPEQKTCEPETGVKAPGDLLGHEESIRRSTQERYRALFENMRDGVAIYEAKNGGEDFFFVDVNGAVERIERVRKEEILGKNVVEVFPGVREFGLLEVFRRVWRTGRSEHHPIALYRDERIAGWRENFVYKLPSGEIVAIYSDETERRQAEEALRRSEENLRKTNRIMHAILQNTHMMAVLLDRDFNFLWVNPAYAATCGYPPNYFQGKNHFALYPGKETQAIFQRVLDTGEPFFASARPFEFPDQPERGMTYWDWSLIPVKDEGGTVSALVLTLAEVTDRIRAEQRLMESEERLRLANKASREVIWDWDILNNAQQWNASGTVVFGWTDIVEGPQTDAWWVSRVHPEDRERVDRGFFAVVNDPGASFWHDEYRFLKADGSYAQVMDRGHVLRDAGGRAVRMIGAMLDITKQREAEEEKARLQAQLAQAQKMESVGRLAGGVAHDFNNMLGIILGHTEMGLEETETGGAIQGRLLKIQKSAQRSADLVRQLLAFARRQQISPRILDINDTVTGLLKMLRRLIGEHIDLAWIPGPGIWNVHMDPSQIDQILANLCINSRDAIRDVGRITIETKNVSLDEEDCAGRPGLSPGHYVMLAVNDNGCGMGKDVLENLFEPFFTTKEVGKGTGLGLATIYGIVKQNNGCIDVASEPGKGTSFKIYFPPHQAEAGREAPETALPPQGGVGTVLLVEDEPMLLEMGKGMLERLGYRVFCAASPKEALELGTALRGEIGLLLTDVLMPGMNGRDLAARLTSLNPRLRCLFMSGHTADTIARHGVLEEGVHFMEKPFSLKELASAVRKVLEGGR